MQGLALTKPELRACPACGHAFSRRTTTCPKCGRVVKERRRWLSGSEWRKIGIGLIAFLGVPAAIIFFLVVVCAPRGH
jgi:ribosomal protein L32